MKSISEGSFSVPGGNKLYRKAMERLQCDYFHVPRKGVKVRNKGNMGSLQNRLHRVSWNLRAKHHVWVMREHGDIMTAQGLVVQSLSHVWICDTVDCSMSGFPGFHHLWEFVQIPVHWVRDAIQPFHPLSSPSPPAFNCPQHQGLFYWVGSSHQGAKLMELWLQHQSFQWIFRVDFP